MSMGRDSAKEAEKKKRRGLTEEELYQLSTVFGVNSPLRDQLRESQERNPLPECFRTFSEGSAYDRIVAGEREFDIPKRGTGSYRVLKELTPHILQEELAKRRASEAKKKQESASTHTSTNLSKKKRTARVKDAAVKTVRKSQRIAAKAAKTPDAPVKKTTGDSLFESESKGLQVLVNELKEYREEIIRYLGRLDSGKQFGGNIMNVPLEELRENLETVQDYKTGCKQSLLELADHCEGAVYQRICDEFRSTIGQKILEWEETLKEWINKKKNPEAPTPVVERIEETPGFAKVISPEQEALTYGELHRHRGSIAPKGPLVFEDEEESEQGSPKERYIREGDYLLDSTVGRTPSNKTPDCRIRLSEQEEQEARLRAMAEVAHYETSEGTQEITSKGTSVDADVTGETIRPAPVEIVGSEQDLANDNEVDRPNDDPEEVQIIQEPQEEQVLGATALPPTESVEKLDEVVEKPKESEVPPQEQVQPQEIQVTVVPPTSEKIPVVGEDKTSKRRKKKIVTPPGGREWGEQFREGVIAAMKDTIEENRARWEKQQEQQRVREELRVRRAQQQLQLPTIQLFDLAREETEECKKLILRESQARGWHPEDAHRLVERFMSMGRFPAEFIDLEYIQHLRQPKELRPANKTVVADNTTLSLKIPPLQDQKTQSNPARTESYGAGKDSKLHKTSEEKISEDVIRFGKLEEERLKLADLLHRGQSTQGLSPSKILVEDGFLISNERLRELFDPVVVAKYYAGIKAKKVQEEADKAKAKQNLHFSSSVIRRDETKEKHVPKETEKSVQQVQVTMSGKSSGVPPKKSEKVRDLTNKESSEESAIKESQKKVTVSNPSKLPPTKVTEPSSDRENASRIPQASAKESVRVTETTEKVPGQSLELGTPHTSVKNPLREERTRTQTFSLEQLTNMSTDPTFRHFLSELLDRTAPHKESTRHHVQSDMIRLREHPPSQDEQEVESNDSSENISRNSRSSRLSRAPSGGSGRRSSGDPPRRDPPERNFGGNNPTIPPTGGGGGGGDDPSSSSSSDDEDDDDPGFNASVSRSSGKDPFRKANRSLPGLNYSSSKDYDPDKKHDKIPLKQPEKFTNGKKPRFEDFLNRFETYAGNKNAPENEKFQALMDCLGGEAKELVQGYTEVKYQTGMYSKVLSILGEHYGDSRNLKSTLLSKLNAMQPIKKFDIPSCTRLSAVLDDFELRAQILCGRSKKAKRFFFESLDTHAQRMLSLFPAHERARIFEELAKRGLDYNFLTIRDWFRLRFATLVKQRQFENVNEIEDQGRANFTTDEGQESDSSAPVYYSDRARSSRERTRETYSDSAYNTEERRSSDEGRRDVPKRTHANPEFAERPMLPCTYCDETDHRIWTCTKFRMLSLEKRYEAVRDKRLCYHCLNKGHRIQDCRISPGKTCGIEGCPSLHHPLVHKPRANQNLVFIEEFLESYEFLEEADEEEEMEIMKCHFSSQVQIYHAVSPDTDPIKADTAHANLLPLEAEHISIRQVTCDLIYPGGRKRVVVALDTCANNTNIEGNLAKKLGLPVQRANIRRELSVVQGSQKFTSNYVNFQLCPVGQQGPIFNVGAYTIDDLINDTPVPDWSKAAEKYPHLKKANPQPPEKDDECVILVGTDFGGLQASYEELRQDLDGAMAGRGPLGWWFQGKTGRLTHKGAVNFSAFKSLYVQARASADWEPEWMTAKRLLEGGLKYDPGFELPEISSHMAWQILASKGYGIDAELASKIRGNQSNFTEKILDIKKDFKEKPLSELRSSEPTVESLESTEGAKSPSGNLKATVSEDSIVRAIEEELESTSSAIQSEESLSSDDQILREITNYQEKTSETELCDISDLREDITNLKIVSKQTFPNLGKKEGQTLTLVTFDDSEAEVLDEQELHQRIASEFVSERSEEVQNDISEASGSGLTTEEQNSEKFFKNMMKDQEDFPEMDSFGMQVILSLEERIQRNLVSRNEMSKELESDQHVFENIEQIKDQSLEEDKKLNELLQKHWELDALGLEERLPRTPANKEPTEAQWSPEQRAIDERMRLVHIPEEKKYMLSIPWKDGERPNFRCNRAAVRARQEGHVRKLPAVQRAKVDEIFIGYLQKDYIRALEGQEIFDTDSRYLPYFCVCDELKETTPVRVVWDCRAVYYGKSLNSEIMDTPNRLQDLGRIFLRLRKFKHTIIADVSEMFLQVLLDPKDRRFHRFIHETRDYEWNRMLFGNVCSPNASQKVFALLCDQFGQDYPEAVETLRNSFYMDDASDSRATEEDALTLAQQLVALLKNASMNIRKFYSNSTLVLKSLPQELLAKQVTIGEEVISVEPGKILGMRYNADENEDFLSYQGKFKSIREWTNRSEVTIVEAGEWTKRKIAKASASIYDPHGLISPFTVRSKIILQEIWRHPELDWDTRIPPYICDSWEKWLEQVFVIQDLKIERWTHYEPGTSYQVHTFCDASEDGMCVAVYIRVRKRNKINVTLVSAKSRVTPLKAESISRLELVACTMGVRLSHAVREVFPTKPEDTFFWTDSMVCLHWIFMPAKALYAYVSHRVGEIQNFTEPRQWRHVPTKMNPADIGTREISAVELSTSELWWKGPEFLYKPQSEWPKRSVFPVSEVPEMKPSLLKASERTESSYLASSLRNHASKKPRRTVTFDPEVTVIGHLGPRMMEIKYRVLNDIKRDWSCHEKWIKRSRRQKLKDLRLNQHPSREKHLARKIALKSLEMGTPQASVKATPDNPKGKRCLRGFAVLGPSRHSTGMLWNGFRKTLRVMALVIRAIRMMMKGKRVTGEILTQEISVARKHLIRIAQRESFGEDIRTLQSLEGTEPPIKLPRKSHLRRLAPFLDEDGILRSRTRLEKTEIYGYDMIYPIILDRHAGFSIQLTEDAHFQLQHPIGHNAVKAKIQAEYIILGLGTLLNTIKWRCVMCKRLFGRPCDQFEAALPTRRLGETRLKAFTDIGIDYAGPFKVIMGRGQRRKKCYILVMTCMATRAVHLEPTGGMDTTDVINAISRFTDIRGVPISITSDNQTSFVKANQDLIDWYESLDLKLIVQACQKFKERRGVKWYFNPPQAPHFGGVFETIVKAAKRALYATIGTSDLNEEDFRTAVSKINSMLNLRPIQKVGNESDWETLTPNHFLNMPDEAIFPPDLPQGRNELQARLRHQIEVQAHFWKRFQREIIPLLAPRSKWFQRVENLKPEQVVVEIDETANRGKWKLAIIEKVFPSSDSFVRSVEIRDSLGRKFMRPISRLIPLLL